MRVLLGIPHNGMCVWEMSKAAWQCSKDHNVEVMDLPGSLLASQFNALYATALNRNEFEKDIELFAMLHGDVAPQRFWLDVLIEELLQFDCHLVSAINIIKDERRLTSSGVAMPGENWKPWRRFTTTELAGYPETFGAGDIGYEGMALLHNTGCWVADIRKPLFHEEEWMDGQWHTRAYFTINDRIVRKKKDDRRRVDVEPEDWFFSRRLHELGANTKVTRKIVTQHYGLASMDNQTVGGNAEDDDVIRLWGQDILEAARADV